MKITQLLDNVYYLPGEIIEIENDIAKMRGTGDPVWDEVIEIKSQRLHRAEAELQRGIDLIASVEQTDPTLYQILVMRYIQGESWRTVAATMPARATLDGYKRKLQRWIKKQESTKV